MAGYWTFCLTLGFFQLEKDIVSNWLLSSKAKCFVNSVTVIANLKSALTRERFTDKHTSDCHGGAEVDNQRAEQWLLESCVLAEEAGVLASGWLFHCCPGSAELSGTTWIWQDAGRAEDKVKFMGEKKNLFCKLKNSCKLQRVNLDPLDQVRFTPDKHHPTFPWSWDSPDPSYQDLRGKFSPKPQFSQVPQNATPGQQETVLRTPAFSSQTHLLAPLAPPLLIFV